MTPSTSIKMPVAATPKPLTKSELKAFDRAAEIAAKQKVVDDKRKAEEDQVAQKKAEVDGRAAAKLEKERGVREADVARKNAELARKKAEEDQKKDRALAEAAARLKQAQAAYQAEMEKAKGIKK